MDKWEYLQLTLFLQDDQLDILGKKGWELVTTFIHPNYGFGYVFKRKIQEVSND